MALTLSVDRVDDAGRELLAYGTEDFPIAFFDDDLTGMVIPYHWHEEMEIVVITEGAVNVRIAGRCFTLKAGEGYFANSSILHNEVLTTPTGHQHAMVFSPRIISSQKDLIWKTYIVPVFANPNIPYLPLMPSVPWQKEILRLAETAWDHGAYEDRDYPLGVRFCLSRVFSLIINHMADMKNESGYTSAFQKDELRIKKALMFIEKNYDAAITIDGFAGSANISVSTCLRLFRTILEETPIQYLMRFRVQKAADELKHTNDRSMAEIAHSCGFTDASYFNRCFKRIYGVTPSEYKR